MKIPDQPTCQLIGEMKQLLDAAADFKHDKIEEVLNEFSAKKDLKLDKMAMRLRAAITSTTNSPSVFHVASLAMRKHWRGWAKWPRLIYR